jgi:Domain of Unknown Function (DUF1543)
MQYKLFMLLLGCKPIGRNTEQHDIFFGVAKELRDLIPDIKAFWKGSGKIHIDAWRTITNVDGYEITVSEKKETTIESGNLFFLNLGGYKENNFDEFHYKMLTIAQDKGKAIASAKQTAFYLHTGFGSIATSHIDDKYGVDVDDIFEIKDILPTEIKENFSINISQTTINNLPEDEMNLGYFKLDAL